MYEICIMHVLDMNEQSNFSYCSTVWQKRQAALEEEDDDEEEEDLEEEKSKKRKRTAKKDSKVRV